MERKITVDKNKCIHCGLCIKDCPTSSIEFGGDKIPEFSEGRKERCVACQHCMAVCPEGALSFGGKNPDDSAEVSYGNSDELLNLIKSRRSIRYYKNESVPTDKIDKIKEMLAFPPTGANADSLHFSIVGTKEKMDEIKKVTYEKILESNSDSPMIQFLKYSFQNGQDISYRDAPSMVVVSVDKSKAVPGCETTDPIIALSYLELYAQSLGMGSMWSHGAVTIVKQNPEVYSLLEIPENYSLSYILLLGIPAVKYKRTVQKEAPSIIII